MHIETIDTEQHVFVIAEVGNNHEGDFTLAEEMIAAASEVGADAVKFQTIIPEQLVHRKESARVAQLEKFQFSFEQFAQLKEKADSCGILFMSTPFSTGAARFLSNLVPAFKIASGDNNFYPLLEVVARSSKPIILSTGMSSLQEIENSVAFIKSVWEEHSIQAELALLHCVGAYPTPPTEVCLKRMSRLRSYCSTVGYSDHALGITAATASVAAGARIVEKHFTLDHNYSDFRDHQLSADVEEFGEMVKQIRQISLMLGNDTQEIMDSEADNARACKRSAVAARDITAHAKLSDDDVLWLRPSGGLSPTQYRVLMEKPITRAKKAGETIYGEDFE